MFLVTLHDNYCDVTTFGNYCDEVSCLEFISTEVYDVIQNSAAGDIGCVTDKFVSNFTGNVQRIKITTVSVT